MKFLSKKIVIVILVQLMAASINCQNISLNGPWSFALDPLNRGEVLGWHLPWKANESDSANGYAAALFDVVDVPHCWSTDIRYNFVGKGWYRRAFKLPEGSTDKLVRLRFEAVFYKCRIFVNGQIAFFHEGGYTPFTVNITKHLKFNELNFISVEVDNSWTEFTVPGARIGNNPSSQVYPWYEYGGITRDVSMLITDKVYIKNQKIESTPNLATGKAAVKIITWVENKSSKDELVTVLPTIVNRTTQAKVALNAVAPSSVSIKAFSTEKVIQSYELSASDVMLWHFDNPNLYDVNTALSFSNKTTNEHATYFGIREFKVNGVELTLNGKPIRVAGSNRHSDHPVYGSTEPAELANIDMGLQRNGNMIFARMNHTPISKHFFKWADEHGYLLVSEIPNWQINPVLMIAQKVKDAFNSQLNEMVEAFWNSPSVIAYSAGNEYPSWTQEGDEWTREQIEHYRSLDSTRLLTFVAHGNAVNPNNLKAIHDAFRHCDFLNFNIYSPMPEIEKAINRLHVKYPNKPIFISEVGLRSDEVKNEQVRIEHLKGLKETINKYPYVVGFSYWSFNDYISRFAGSNKNGYRPWGIVDGNRKPKELYTAFQKELSPVVVNVQKDKISITAPSGFPSYTINSHVLKIVVAEKVINTIQIPTIEIGKTVEIKADKLPAKATIIIENKKGFAIYNSSL